MWKANANLLNNITISEPFSVHSGYSETQRINAPNSSVQPPRKTFFRTWLWSYTFSSIVFNVVFSGTSHENDWFHVGSTVKAENATLLCLQQRYNTLSYMHVLKGGTKTIVKVVIFTPMSEKPLRPRYTLTSPAALIINVSCISDISTDLTTALTQRQITLINWTSCVTTECLRAGRGNTSVAL